ncbi:MAG: lysylphosphatidylglycerol synthase transmembrane domain-containing protein, partial [Chloroflexota bacterium]
VVAREATRVVEWRLLLKMVGLRTRWRHALLAQLAGDASQIVPAGIYLENYLLHQEEGVGVARSLAATIAMQFIEAALSWIVVLAIGVPNWAWLRPVVVLVMCGYGAFLVGISRPAMLRWLDGQAGRGKPFAWLVGQLKGFLKGLDHLMQPGAILRAAGLGLLYMLFTITAFYLIANSYSVAGIGWAQAAVVYSFALAVVVLNPLPTDFGVSEGTGVGLFLAFGVPLAEGLVIMLIMRFTILLSTAVLAAIAFLLFHGELKHLSEGPAVDEDSGPDGLRRARDTYANG